MSHPPPCASVGKRPYVWLVWSNGNDDIALFMPVGGKVLLGIINDLVGSQRLHQVYIGGTAYPGHFCLKVPGKLDRSRADTSRSPIDQDFLPTLNLGDLSQENQRGWCPIIDAD